MKLGKMPSPSSQVPATPRAGHRHQLLEITDGAFCDANSCFLRAVKCPLYNPSRPSGSALAQALKTELQIPEGELRADNSAAHEPWGRGASCGSPRERDGIAVPKGGLDKGDDGRGQPLSGG